MGLFLKSSLFLLDFVILVPVELGIKKSCTQHTKLDVLGKESLKSKRILCWGSKVQISKWYVISVWVLFLVGGVDTVGFEQRVAWRNFRNFLERQVCRQRRRPRERRSTGYVNEDISSRPEVSLDLESNK